MSTNDDARKDAISRIPVAPEIKLTTKIANNEEIPGYALIQCPNCGHESYINHEVLHGPPYLNVNRCLTCFTEVTLISIDPLTIQVIKRP